MSMTHEPNTLLGRLFRREASPVAENPTPEMIRAWLVQRVAAKLQIDPATVDASADFADFGLDSRSTLALAGDMETWLGRELSPTLLWDYPSIEGIVTHLAAGGGEEDNAV